MTRLALDLRHSLERQLETGRSSSNEEAPLFIRASGIGDCARKQTYLAQGYSRTEMSAPAALMAIQGNWIEDGVANYLIAPREDFILFDQQRELNYYNNAGELVIRGHIDGLIRENNGDLPSDVYLWEMKGMSAFRYSKLLTTPGGIEKSNYGYFAQVQTYMELLNREGAGVKGCLFTVIAKDPSAANNVRRGSPPLHPIYVEEIPYDPEMGEVMLTRASRLHQLLMAGELAERERNPYQDWDCSERFCPFYAQCEPKKHLAPLRGLKRAA